MTLEFHIPNEYSITKEWPKLSGYYWIKYAGFTPVFCAEVEHGSRGTDPNPDPWLHVFDETWDMGKEPPDFDGFVCKNGEYVRVTPPWNEFGEVSKL